MEEVGAGARARAGTFLSGEVTGVKWFVWRGLIAAVGAVVLRCPRSRVASKLPIVRPTGSVPLQRPDPALSSGQSARDAPVVLTGR